MNIFKEKRSLIGDAPLERLHKDSDGFWQQASAIRKQLGTRGYLLDEYLSILFESISPLIPSDASDEGFSGISGQQKLFREILSGKTDSQSHPLFEKAKDCVDSLPLSYQEPFTKTYIYCALLEKDILSFAVNQYLDWKEDAFDEALDMPKFNRLYRNICDLLGSEKDMDSLNILFRDRFMAVTNMMSFIQGFSNDLMFLLTYKDMETGRKIFQLILDHMQ